MKRPCRPGLPSDLFSSTKEYSSHRPPFFATLIAFQRYGEFVEPFLKGCQVKGRISFPLLKAGESAYMAFITDHSWDSIGAAVDGPCVITDALTVVSQQRASYAGK